MLSVIDSILICLQSPPNQMKATSASTAASGLFAKSIEWGAFWRFHLRRKTWACVNFNFEMFSARGNNYNVSKAQKDPDIDLRNREHTGVARYP